MTTTVQFNPINALFPENLDTLDPLFPLQSSSRSEQISAKFDYHFILCKSPFPLLVFQFLAYFHCFSTNHQGGAR